MIRRHVDGPFDEDQEIPDDTPGEPQPYLLLADDFPAKGLYVLDGARTFGMSPGFEIPEIPEEAWDDWTDEEWDRFEREQKELEETAERMRRATQTWERGQLVAFYRFTTDPAVIYRVLNGQLRGYKPPPRDPTRPSSRERDRRYGSA